MQKILKIGLNAALKQKRIVFLIYMIQLIIAIPLGLQVYQVINASIGDSLSMDIIQEGFNRTVFEDFLNVHGASITPLIGTFRYVVPVYLVVSIFLHAGIMGNIINDKSKVSSFFSHGVKYFLSFLIINVCFVMTVVIWSCMVWFPFLMWMGNPVEDLASEKSLVIGGGITFFIFLFGILMLWLWAFDVKVHCITTKNKIKTCLINGWSSITSSGVRQWLTCCIYLIIHGLTIIIYFLLTGSIGATSLGLILLVVLLQQAFSLFRIGLRVALFSSLIKAVNMG
jgi:hypothetical protein